MFKFINTNLIHNVLNAAIVLVPAVEMLNLAPLLGAERALQITALLAVVKIVINILRDGLTGLAKKQPAVK